MKSKGNGKKKWYLYKCSWCDIVFAISYSGVVMFYCEACKNDRAVEEL